MSGAHALRALEGLALRSVGEGMAHASARGRDGAREIAWVYGGEPPQPGDGAFLVDVPFFDGDGLEDIDDILIGAEHEVFQRSVKKAELIDGKENTLLTITSGGEGGSSLHFSQNSATAK